MRIGIVLIVIGLLASCTELHDAKTSNIIYSKSTDSSFQLTSKQDSTSKLVKHYPNWVEESNTHAINKLLSDYELDQRLTPSYLEADFNGDNNLDVILSIKHKTTQKVGFAIIHGKTSDLFIIGAGTKIKSALSDNLDYIDLWSINQTKTNASGLNEDGDLDSNGPLILENASIRIEKTEVGGGLIYWDHDKYAYFHQTC